MSRVIKFRAWIKSLKTMSDVRSLSFARWGKGGADMVLTSLISDGGSARKIDDAVLMQNTGLSDKNDKEIYEGDILKGAYNDHLYVVEFKHGEFICEKGIHILGRSLWDKTEIVGNIYENPGLLQQPA